MAMLSVEGLVKCNVMVSSKDVSSNTRGFLNKPWIWVLLPTCNDNLGLKVKLLQPLHGLGKLYQRAMSKSFQGYMDEGVHTSE